jgi:hypothetical protein
MRRFQPRRPNAATLIASAALFVALGGTGYAAFSLPKNSVGGKQLKNNAVTTNKIKNGAVTGSKINLGTLGTVPSASHASSADSATHASMADSAAALNGNTIRWAVVDASGVIAAQSGGFTVTFHTLAGTILDSSQPVTGHAIIVSNGVAGGDIAARGAAIAGPCGTASDSSPACATVEPDANDGHHVVITTQSTSGGNEPHSFYIVIY